MFVCVCAHSLNVCEFMCKPRIKPSCTQGGYLDSSTYAERSPKRSVGLSAGSANDTMDSAPLELPPEDCRLHPTLGLPLGQSRPQATQHTQGTASRRDGDNILPFADMSWNGDDRGLVVARVT